MESFAIMVRSNSANPAKVKKVIKFLIKWMKVTDRILRQGGSRSLLAPFHPTIFPQQDSDGREGACVRAPSATPPQPDQAKRLCNCAINVTGVRVEDCPSSAGLGACERVMAVTPSPFPPWPSPVALPQGWLSPGAALMAENKQKSWNQVYYAKRSSVYSTLTPPLLPLPPPPPPLPAPSLPPADS